MKRFLLLILFIGISACTSVRPLPDSATTPPTTDIAPTQTSEAPVPYPTPDTLNQLSIDVLRLQNQVNHLQKRVQQLKRSKITRTHPPRYLVRRLPSSTAAVANNAKPPASSFILHTARTQYRAGNYAAVIKTLHQADDGGRGTETDRQSMFLLLQSHYKLAQCESAINIGQRYITYFRTSPEAAEALFLIGQCQWQMQQKDIARHTWRKLIRMYPDSAAAKRAAQQLN